jgi:hypothetical protein
MADQKTSGGKKLTDIKERLRAGKLTPKDIKALEKMVINAENAAKALRAAMVE